MMTRESRLAMRRRLGAAVALVGVAACTVASVTFEPLADAAAPPDAIDGAPETTMVMTPPDPSPAAQADFAFTSATPGAAFACRLDGAAYAACTSPVHVEVADGPHAFSVRAWDERGGDPTPATYAWVVDTAAPLIALRDAPPDPTMARRADVTVDVTGAVMVTCQLDDRAATACPGDGRLGYADLALGAHQLTVRAVDAAGNVATAGHRWNIVTCAPVTIEAESLMLGGGWSLATGTVLQGGQGAGVTTSSSTPLAFEFVGRGFTAFVREGPVTTSYVLGIDGVTGRFDLSAPNYQFQAPIAATVASDGVHQGAIACLTSTCLVDFVRTRCN